MDLHICSAVLSCGIFAYVNHNAKLIKYYKYEKADQQKKDWKHAQ